MVLPAGGIFELDDADKVAAVGARTHLAVRGDSLVDRSLPIPWTFAASDLLHILVATQEVDPVPLFELLPESKIDGRTVPNHEELPAFWNSLAQRVCSATFQTPHVMLLAALGLIRRSQVPHEMAAQIEGVEMSDGVLLEHFRPILPD